jgi:hypothetical protein
MGEENKKTEKEIPNNIIPSLATPDKMIPKFCTQIVFGITEEGETKEQHVVMNLIYKEGDQQAVLIDRVMISVHHAENAVKVLNDLLERAKKGEIRTATTK